MVLSLVYMAKPIYGGWVSFTSHMALKYGLKIYKVSKRTERLKTGEPRMRKYGYGTYYQNMSIEDIKKLPNILITAIDKNYYEALSELTKNNNSIRIVIHDPTEVKGKSSQPVLDAIHNCKVITIRQTVKKYLSDKYNIKSTFKHHPFYEYPILDCHNKEGAVAISRIDFDKHTDIIIRANDILESNHIDIYGAKNDRYVYFKLNQMGIDLNKYYKGSFKKDFNVLNNILNPSRFVVDLSIIKNDGGGSQYTFLEALYQKCILILHKDWVNTNKTIFKDGYNCITVGNEEDIVDILTNQKIIKLKKLQENSFKILKPHLEVSWDI